MSIRPRSMPSSRPTRPGSARITARRSSPRPGPIRPSSRPCWTTPARPSSTLGHVSRVGDHLVAVENTPQRHNMVVCTLCSCYPWEMLGLPPVWYKAAPYRSRAVKDPRGVLADFGVSLPKETEIRVWDSTAETRFLVLPMRPEGTEGWSEAAARRARHPRLHDRHRISEDAGSAIVNGVHDMGGMDGFGKVEPEPNEPMFHAEWEAPRAGDGARDGRRRRLQHRHVALLSGDAAAARLSRQLLLQEMVSRPRGHADRQGFYRRRRGRRRPRDAAAEAAQARQVRAG